LNSLIGGDKERQLKHLWETRIGDILPRLRAQDSYHWSVDKNPEI